MTGLRTATMVAMLTLGASAMAAQQPGPPTPHAGPRPMGNSAMTQEQMRMMDSMTSRLDSLVTRMNKATSKTKVAAMADVINELVAQRKAMRSHMGVMMGPMMDPHRNPSP
jgi:hypothetical protein